jgi:sigma-B regulation protein RsbU (phosphoserine phosphatase)
MRVRIAPGELLALCSDGVLEAAAASGASFGVAGLAGAVAARRTRSLPEAAAEIAAEVAGFAAGAGRQDDLTLLLLRRRVAPGGAA